MGSGQWVVGSEQQAAVEPPCGRSEWLLLVGCCLIPDAHPTLRVQRVASMSQAGSSIDSLGEGGPAGDESSDSPPPKVSRSPPGATCYERSRDWLLEFLLWRPVLAVRGCSGVEHDSNT